MEDQRSDLAAWEIAERPFKLWLKGWFNEMEKYCQEEKIDIPAEYAKHIRMMKLAKTLVKRMDHKSLMKIPEKAGEVTIEQTPNEDDTHPWKIKLEMVGKEYQIDLNVAKKFAEILVEADQPRAEHQFKVALGSVYSSVMQVYDGMRYYNKDLMANVILLMNEKAGVYGIATPLLPKFHYPVFLGVTVEEK